MFWSCSWTGLHLGFLPVDARWIIQQNLGIHYISPRGHFLRWRSIFTVIFDFRIALVPLERLIDLSKLIKSQYLNFWPSSHLLFTDRQASDRSHKKLSRSPLQPLARSPLGIILLLPDVDRSKKVSSSTSSRKSWKGILGFPSGRFTFGLLFRKT